MRRVAACAALLCALSQAGCATLKLAVASGAELGNDKITREADLAYGTLKRQRLDVYVPRAPAPPEGRALVVFLHGGSWSSGSKDLYRFVGAALAERGIVAVLPNYRLYPQVRLAGALDDAVHAVAWAEREAARLGADPARVLVMGHSAGAQLAALVAADPAPLVAAGGRPVRAFVGLAGPYDFLPLTDPVLEDYFGPPERYPESQPVRFVSRASAPSFLAQGEDDLEVAPRNAASLAARLAAEGVSVEVRLLPGEGHASLLRHFARPYRGGDPLLDELVRFVTAPPPRRTD